MNKLKQIFSIVGVLLIALTACEDMNDMHEKWMQEGERNYVGKIDSVFTVSGDERINFNCYLSDQRVEFVTLKWSELGIAKEVRVPVPRHESDEVFSFIVGENETINEGDYTFTMISDDDNGTNSIDLNTIGKVYGEQYRSGLNNRLVTGFELTDNGIYLEFSNALNSADKGIELYYNSGTEDIVRSYTAEELKVRIFLETPDFTTPITYATLYQPKNCMDIFKADFMTPRIQKDVNIALGKPATSSPTLNDALTADKAVDGIIGDNGSRWINARVAGIHWLEVDFESSFDIKKVIIHDGTPVGDFLLQVEVDGVWQDLQSVTGNTANVFTGVYEGVNANKIRYAFETYDSDPSFIIRMFELEVYTTITIQ